MAIDQDTNIITSAISHTCGTSWYLWIKTLRPVGKKLFWSFAKPVWKQELKWATGKSWIKHLKQYLVDAGAAEGSGAADGLWQLFKVAEVFDALLWYWFIASVTEEVLVEFASLIIAGSRCPLEPVGSYEASVPEDAVTSYAGWVPLDVWRVNTGSIGYAGYVDIPESGFGSLGVSITFRQFDGAKQGVSVRIVGNTGGADFVLDQADLNHNQVDGSTPVTVAATLSAIPGQRATLQVQGNVNDSLGFGSLVADVGDLSGQADYRQ